MKKLKDYLHLYIGCECIMDGKEKGKLIGFDSRLHDKELEMVCYTIQLDSGKDDWMVYNDDEEFSRIKPCLYSFSDIKEYEIIQLIRVNHPENDFPILSEIKNDKGTIFFQARNERMRYSTLFSVGYGNNFDPEETRFLLSKYFDLFGLIPAGLAIRKIDPVIGLAIPLR